MYFKSGVFLQKEGRFNNTNHSNKHSFYRSLQSRGESNLGYKSQESPVFTSLLIESWTWFLEWI